MFQGVGPQGCRRSTFRPVVTYSSYFPLRIRLRDSQGGSGSGPAYKAGFATTPDDGAPRGDQGIFRIAHRLESRAKSRSLGNLYPEYSGTIAREILKREGNPGLAELNRSFAPAGLAVSVALGFNNTYTIGVREDLVSRLGLKSITDLAAHPACARPWSRRRRPRQIDTA